MKITENHKSIIYLVAVLLWSFLMIPVSNLIGWEGRNSGYEEGAVMPKLLASIFTGFGLHFIFWVVAMVTKKEYWPSWINRKLLFVAPMILTFVLLMIR